MPRGRKKKIQDPVVEKAVEEIHKIIDSGEKDLLENPIYNAPVHMDPEVSSGLQAARIEDRVSDNSMQDFYNWDIPLSENITFFDSNLSYEISGYRPINEIQGLDFNPEWFTETRKIKQDTGMYCSYPKGSKKYLDFWKEQFRRCNEGYISHGYRITGDNYFFLNFYRLKDISTVKVAGGGRRSNFPTFYAKQYEYFHYIEICEKTGHDVCALKARGVGFSEIAASLGVRLYSTVEESHVLYSAYSDDFLSAVLRKCWEQLEFLNADSEGGMRHVRQKYNSDYHKRASKLNKQREESGFMSEILGIAADIPRKLRGDRADRLFFEEAGSNPVLIKTYLQSKALVEISGRKFGTRLVWGTGGDSGPALAGLSEIFNNPEGFGVLPYRHSYTKTGEQVLTAYFIPAFTFVNKDGYVDKRGVTDSKKAKAFYEEQRNKLLLSGKADTYRIDCAEFCFTPDDALALEGDNDFDIVALQEQLSNIILHKVGPRPERGFLEYDFGGREHREENIKGFKWIKDPKGKVLILEHPQKDEGNTVYKNLYVAGIDSIDLGQDETSEGTKNGSNFCIVIKKRVRGMDSPKYVAIYKDRPKDIREAFKIALRLLQYYNCKAVLEKSKVSFVTYLRDRKKADSYLMRRPRSTMADTQRGRSKEFGAPATEAIIRHQLDLIAAYISDYASEIWFEEMLQELIKYSYENKKKFDIVAAMGMAELGDEEMAGAVPQRETVYEDEWEDFGWYKDERGIIRYGTIPKQNPQIPNYNLYPDYDDGRIRTSNPRFN